MIRNILLATVAFVAVMLAPMARAQNSTQGHAKAQASKQLVAWTQDQKVQPMPATQPTAKPQPDTQTPNTPTTAQQDDTQKQPAAQAFAGMILKSGDNYVLQTVDNITYQLDDQERAKAYEGKQVQVTGSLDKTTNTIKVHDIKQAT